MQAQDTSSIALNPVLSSSNKVSLTVHILLCLQIEVLDSVKDNRWLKEMLECFHAGDLHRYDELCTKHKSVLNNQPALTENVHQLRQKITILCLMELIFRYEALKKDRLSACACQPSVVLADPLCCLAYVFSGAKSMGCLEHLSHLSMT